MRAAFAARAARRCFSTTPVSSAKPLPFEKPIFESKILDKAAADQRTYENITYYGNLLVIASGLSLVGRIGYYLAYGKEGGAGPIPRRSRSKE